MALTFRRYLLVALIGALVVFSVFQKSHAQLSMPLNDRLAPVTSPINAPTDVALDQYENIYVVESVNNRLMVFSQSGQYQATMTGLDKPLSVAVDSGGRIFIANKNRGNVEAFDGDFNFLFKLGTGDGEFTQPNDIAIDRAGKIYVADYLGDKIKVYNPDGSFDHSYGSTGSGSGYFNYPASLVLDESSGEIVVLDHQIVQGTYGPTKGARIQTFSMSWGFLRSFGQYGDAEGQMSKPQAVAVDAEGRAYVTESQYNIAYVYDNNPGSYFGTYLGKITNLAEPLRTPLGLVLGKSNRLYIASLRGGQIEVYGISPYTNMTVSPLTLFFEALENAGSPAAQWIIIENSGTRTLDWTVSSPENWIVLPVLSGSTAGSSTDPAEAGINLSGLLPGAYYGEVMVTADSGAREIVDVRLNVLPNDLAADPGGPYTGIEGQPLLFDGSGSGGNPLLYEWDVNYDGISASYEYSSSSPTQAHTYTANGTYAVQLRITADGTAADTAVTAAEIMDSVPYPDFIGMPLSGASPLTVSFINYSTGHDQPLQFAWDLDNDGITDSTDADPLHTYTIPGTYTITLTVTDADGSTNSMTRFDYVLVSARYDLSVFKSGSGSGSVTSVPSGIACGADCSESYGDVTLVTMSALPDAGSYFTGWSGSCTGTGNCQVMMNTDRDVAAIFDICQNPPLKVAGTISSYHDSLQAAYNAASAGDVIQSQAAGFTEDLMIDRNKFLTLQGGYSCEYAPGSGMTTIRGRLTISSGSVIMENIRIE